MKQFILLVIFLSMFFSIYKSYFLLIEYQTLKESKEDIAEINKINYGLFNLQWWKKQALEIFENKIETFEISPKAYDQVVVELEIYLRNIYKEYIDSGKIFDKIFEEAEKNPNMNKFFLKLIKENTRPQIKELNIPQYIPSMAIQLANELKKQEPQLRDIMRAELKKLLQEETVFSYIDPRQSYFDKYQQPDLHATNTYLTNLIAAKQASVDALLPIVFGLLLFMMILACCCINWIGSQWLITTLTLNSIIFLFLGVKLPMIDIEAVLNAFNIDVLGSSIRFDKQYLYYQSKSILDVTQTLIQGHGFDLKLVGYMVLCFSVIFPLIKLILSGLYLYHDKIRNNKVIQNIIFYLGKWSMADVFVVALFMAYIGFYGIITSQLNSFANNEGGFAVETLNASKLAPGALFFTTYCVFSIIIGIIINKLAMQKNTFN